MGRVGIGMDISVRTDSMSTFGANKTWLFKNNQPDSPWGVSIAPRSIVSKGFGRAERVWRNDKVWPGPIRNRLLVTHCLR